MFGCVWVNVCLNRVQFTSLTHAHTYNYNIYIRDYHCTDTYLRYWISARDNWGEHEQAPHRRAKHVKICMYVCLSVCLKV